MKDKLSAEKNMKFDEASDDDEEISEVSGFDDDNEFDDDQSDEYSLHNEEESNDFQLSLSLKQPGASNKKNLSGTPALHEKLRQQEHEENERRKETRQKAMVAALREQD